MKCPFCPTDSVNLKAMREHILTVHRIDMPDPSEAKTLLENRSIIPQPFIPVLVILGTAATAGIGYFPQGSTFSNICHVVVGALGLLGIMSGGYQMKPKQEEKK